jgi:hypothetical protein
MSSRQEQAGKMQGLAGIFKQEGRKEQARKGNQAKNKTQTGKCREAWEAGRKAGRQARVDRQASMARQARMRSWQGHTGR